MWTPAKIWHIVMWTPAKIRRIIMWTPAKKLRIIMLTRAKTRRKILSKIVIDGEFDNLSFPEIVSTLSVFLKSRNTKDGIISDLNISDEHKKLLRKISNMSSINKDKENEINNILHFKYWNEWDLNLEMVDMVFQWCSGKSWTEVKNLLLSEKKLFEGNFVKNILSLKNIIKSVYLIAKLQNNTKLLDTLYQYETKLVKGIVVLKTLFL